MTGTLISRCLCGDKFNKKINTYNPHKSNVAILLKSTFKRLNKLNEAYETLFLLRDYNLTHEEESIAEFFNLCNLKNLAKQNACFKNSDKPSCIDLILTNSPRSLQNMVTFETGISDFHKLTFVILKQHFPKQKPKVNIHRQYQNFCNNYLRIILQNTLLKYGFNDIYYDNFIKAFLIVLNNHASLK